jgi:UDP-2-acetamido-3-amino-2,3-dideoxy-glucuronate N-acetyltransferase
MNVTTERLETQPALALIGAGYWGKNLARNFHALGALRTICDASQATLESYGTDYATVQKVQSVKDVLMDTAIRQVAIAAPAVLHYELARAALLAGKDVFVEKPLCLEVEEAQKLVALAQKQRLVLMVGHLLQYHPCIKTLQSLLAEGELGKLHYITSNRLNLGKIRREENALWSFAPHDLSVILSLAGNQVPERIACTGESYLTNGVADTTLTSLRFAGGVRAHIFVSWLNPFKEQKLTVVGSNGMAVFDDTRPWPEKLLLHRHYLTWTNGQIPTPNKNKGQPLQVAESEPLRNECAHFLECCATRRKPCTDGSEGLRVLEVLRAAQRSLDNDGQAITPAAPSNGHTDSLKLLHLAPATPHDSIDYYVHPTAVVDEGADIGRGTKIWHFCHVMKGAKIGERCVLGQNVNVDGGTIIGNNVKIQNNVSIYTGLVIQDDVFLGPSCVLTNVSNPRSEINRHSLYEKTLVRRGATIGANATIVCGVTIGRYAFIGAGAVVTKDVPDYALMVGNPARQKGWMSRHGHILRDSDADGVVRCPESGLHYVHVGDGNLKCVDLQEDAALPAHLTKGERCYHEFKPRVSQSA